MSRYSLDYLLDSLMVLTDAEFEARHATTKAEARAFVTHGTLPNGWRNPRSALFRLAAANAIAEYARTGPTPTEEQDMADCAPEGTYHDHDHDADWPAECEVCRGPIRQGFGNFCSDAHRKIIDGEPTMQEQALNR